MPLVADHVLDGSGAPVVGTDVTIVLRAGDGTGTVLGTGAVIGDVALTTGSDGAWSANLVPNSRIVPAGTFYRITVRLPGPTTAVWNVVVPDGPGPYQPADIQVTLLEQPVPVTYASLLQAQVDELSDQLLAEAARATAAEATIAGAAAAGVSSEASARTAAVSAEASRASAAEAAETASRLAGDATEGAARIAADNAALAARTAAEAALTAADAAEASTRATADGNESAARIAAVAAEAARALAAESALAARASASEAFQASVPGTYGAGSTQWLKEVGAAFGLAFTVITASDAVTGLPTAATVRWPDGTTGAFTGTIDAGGNGYSGFTAVYGAKTLTATGISYNANGIPIGPTSLAVA